MVSKNNKLARSLYSSVYLCFAVSSAFAFSEYKNVSQAEQGMSSSCVNGVQIIKTAYGDWTLVSQKKMNEKASPVPCADKEKSVYKFGNTELVTKSHVLRYAYPSSSNYLWVFNLKPE